MSARVAALAALIVLGATLVAVVALTTPWHPLAGEPAGGSPAERVAVAVDVHRDFTTAEIQREEAFHRAIRPPAYVSLALGLVVLAILALTPWGARVAGGVARPLGGGWGWQVGLGALAVAALARLASLPFDARSESVLRRYGLSTQTWGSWALDQVKGFAVSTGLLILAVLLLFALIRALPGWWWIPAAAGAALLVVAVSFAYPLVVEPVFNTFTPMPAGPLRTSLLQLAADDQVPVRDVLVADASRRTSSLNAYVSGFGATRRVVVYDTLLAKADPDEVRSVVAHELGHAKRNDVLYGTAIGALGAAAAVCVLYLAMTWAPVLRRAGVSAASDGRAVGVAVGLVALITFASGPMQMLVSRHIEARADVHALDLTRDPATFIRMEHRLSVENLSDLDPSPVIYALFSSHPSGPQRIAMARTWARRHGEEVAPR